MDNVIGAVVNPGRSLTLTPAEQELFVRMGTIPTVQELVPELRTDPVIQRGIISAGKPDAPQGPSAVGKGSEAPAMAGANSAAAVAASNAATNAVSALPNHGQMAARTPTANQNSIGPHHPSHTPSFLPSGMPTADKTTPTPDPWSEPHKFKPNMSTLPTADSTAAAAPPSQVPIASMSPARSEERRVGKECPV